MSHHSLPATESGTGGRPATGSEFGLRAIGAHQAALRSARGDCERLLPLPSASRESGILIIEDSPAFALRTKAQLECSPHDWGSIEVAHDLAAGRAALRQRRFAAILCDLDLPDSRGLDTIEAVLASSGPAAVVVLSGLGDHELGMQAVSAGAQDYVVKGRDDELVLERVLAYALERRRILNQIRRILDQHERDLAAAAEVQRSLFPHHTPDLPGFECAWRHRASASISGDICNLVAIDEHHYACYLLDVMGHGVSAALLACQVSRLLMPGPGSILLDDEEPAGSDLVLAELNQRFPACHTGGRFCTIAYAVLDVRDGTVEFGNAGHPPLLHCRRDGSWEEVQAAGIAIGLTPHARFEHRRLRLEPGERLVLYSDGLAESRDPAGRMFGTARLNAALADAEQDLATVFDRTIASCSRWTQQDDHEDDCTLIGLQRHR